MAVAVMVTTTIIPAPAVREAEPRELPERMAMILPLAAELVLLQPLELAELEPQTTEPRAPVRTAELGALRLEPPLRGATMVVPRAALARDT